MSNISAHPSYSADFMYPVPIVNQETPFIMSPNLYPMVLQILAQLRAAQSEWNAWKIVGTTFQNSLQKEQQLRLKDKLNFHAQEQQLLNQIQALRSQSDKGTEVNTVLHRDMEMLKQNISLCKEANSHAQSRMQELEHANGGISTLNESILNLTEVIEKKNEILVQTAEEAKRNKDKLQDALQTIKEKDAQLEDMREERKTLKESLELTKQAIGSIKVQEQENKSNFQTILEQKLNAMELDLKNKSECEKREVNEELGKFKEEILKLKAEGRESQSKLQGVVEEKLNIVETLTKQVHLNEELRKQNEELQNALANLKIKSEEDKLVLNEEFRICKENVVSVIGPCGPVQLRQIKMPHPEGDLYKTALQKRMHPGCVIQIVGRFKSTGDTPEINLDYLHGIALHIVFRFTRGHICRNTFSGGKWGKEETDGGMPVQRGQQVNITITSTADDFHICINGALFTTYKHRADKKLIAGIWIRGPLELQRVLYFAPANL